MLPLRRVNHLCSSILSGAANRLRKTRKKQSSAVPLISKRSHVGNLRQIRKQGKGRSSKRKENRRLSFLFAPAAGRGTFPPSADGESPAEVQRKTSRPLGANTLTQFACPAGSVQKRSRPLGANTLTQFACPGQSVPGSDAEKWTGALDRRCALHRLFQAEHQPCRWPAAR